MSIHKNDKRGTWDVRWREFGKQKSKSFRMRYEAKEFSDSLFDDQKNSEGITFADYSLQWMRDYCKLENAESTWSQTQGRINLYFIPVFGSKLLTELDSNDLAKVKIQLKNAGKKPKTINNILGIAKRMLEVAVEWDELKSNPFRKVKQLPVPKQPFDYWTFEESKRFLGYAKAYNTNTWEITTIALNTGMRYGEILGLLRDAVDFDQRQITVKRQYIAKLKKISSEIKTKDWRIIPMNAAVYEVLKLRRLYGLKQPFFEPTKNAARHWKRMAKKAGVKPIRVHDLRHTFASHLVMKGVPLFHISQLLGHTDIKMTQKYSHIRRQDLRDVVTLLSSQMANVRQLFDKNPEGELSIQNH